MNSFPNLKEAYIKLKSHIYHDSSDLFLRQKLALFECGLEENNLGRVNTPDLTSEGITKLLDEKLHVVAKLIKNNHIDNGFNEYLNKIDFKFLPKKFDKGLESNNFLTNQRVADTYKLDKVTVFADFPIELHLIGILWLMEFGYKLDRKLDESCIGNRLILNKDKERKIVGGSALFKPYFVQYQKWRDNAVNTAKSLLESGSDIAFINLDVKDYFYSVRFDFTDIEKVIFNKTKGYEGGNNLHDLFKKILEVYTFKIKDLNYPDKSINEIKEGRFILPIGFAPSYVLANFYLHDFDKRLKRTIPNAYFGRYVDDIIIVLKDPCINPDNICEEVDFSFAKYLKTENINGNEKITFANTEDDFQNDYKVSKSSRFILKHLYPLVKLVDFPGNFEKGKEEKNSECCKSSNPKSIFKINCVENLYIQAEKTLVYYFDKNESIAVIDKLKKELNERASEFRDIPEDKEADLTFDDQAYYLIFDGTEGKIRTLKDYQENRYGLSIFLAQKIFSALKKDPNIDSIERDKILSLFKGVNNLEYFHLWEKIFTYFLVYNDHFGFLTFFKHTLNQIIILRNSNLKIGISEIKQSNVAPSLSQYLMESCELAISLNPNFILDDAIKNEMQLFNDYLDTNHLWPFLEQPVDIKNKSFIYRWSNLIRHHYVAHPLLNYTELCESGSDFNLIDRNFPQNLENPKECTLNWHKMVLSPRRVKFWECCIASANELLHSSMNDWVLDTDGRHVKCDDFNLYSPNLLEKAKAYYKAINNNHVPSSSSIADKIFELKSTFSITNSDSDNNQPIESEIHISQKNKFSKNLSIAIANTNVLSENIESSIKGEPNLSRSRYQSLAKLLNEANHENVEMFLLPESYLPYSNVSILAKYAEKNQFAIVSGLEHWNIKDICFNFIVNVIPFEIDGIKDAVVLYRLKNHYAHFEELIIRGFGYKVPKPLHSYDLINWKNLYFTSYYCFEFADTHHRSLFKSKVDLLIASEWNKDTHYFSNIVEALSRDMHCYIAQVNTSQFGDSRVTKPSETATKDILKLKGGRNDTIIVGEIDIKKLREFQLKYFERTQFDKDKSFKPLPPDWNFNDVKTRIKNGWFVIDNYYSSLENNEEKEEWQ